MSELEEKLSAEIMDLNQKIHKLERFMKPKMMGQVVTSEDFENLSFNQQFLLKAQLDVMDAYAKILNLRLNEIMPAPTKGDLLDEQ